MWRYLCLIISVVLFACDQGAVFQKTHPHAAYGNRLRSAGLGQTALSKLWFDAAEKSLSGPVSIHLPYKQIGFFPSDKPTAIGLRFTAKRGVQLHIEIKQQAIPAANIFADLWQFKNESPDFLIAADTANASITYDVKETADYILRLQPELLVEAAFELSITVSGSLAYPVAGPRASIGSVWGDARDAGARLHEGIDIFDKKGTPVVAAADGRITRLGDGGIGGKTVWMRVAGKGLSLYYAHLDQQLVQEGQSVKVGDTLGLMGNTGNARTTPPHLHFGIYTSGGPVDPLPFVDRRKRQAPLPGFTLNALNQYYRTTTEVHKADLTIPVSTMIYIAAADHMQLIGTLPDGIPISLPVKSAQPIDNQLNIITLKDTAALLASPVNGAAQKLALSPQTKVAVKGYYASFAYIKLPESGLEGWVSQNHLR
jgi:murein DD-endopeptidase MepM/ murein hydrolase activator NlpD